jgi:hypothetical protein
MSANKEGSAKSFNSKSQEAGVVDGLLFRASGGSCGDNDRLPRPRNDPLIIDLCTPPSSAERISDLAEHDFSDEPLLRLPLDLGRKRAAAPGPSQVATSASLSPSGESAVNDLHRKPKRARINDKASAPLVFLDGDDNVTVTEGIANALWLFVSQLRAELADDGKAPEKQRCSSERILVLRPSAKFSNPAEFTIRHYQQLDRWR